MKNLLCLPRGPIVALMALIVPALSAQNPIRLFGPVKVRLVRAAKASTAPALDQAIADLLPQIAAGNAGGWFRLRLGSIQK
ncbi:MAG: hypothetical protein ACYCSP_04140 [Acidobacteriaceae bacterium]